MIKSILLSNPKGLDINLVLEDPYEIGIAVTNITGLGYPKTTVNKQSIPASDISLYQSSKVEARNIVLTLQIIENMYAEKSRHNIYDVLIIGMPIYIEIATDIRILHTVGYIETVEPDIFSQEEQIQVSIICPDPYLYTGAKLIYTSYDQNKGHKNFQFSKIQNNNWFDITGLPQNGRPMSILSEDEDFLFLNIWSRFENPKGFSLEINPVKINMGFNKIILEYDYGSIHIYGNLELDEYNGTIEDNFFYNSILIIENDINDQKILKISGDESIDITNNCIIYGDYPTLKKGWNIFKSYAFGLTTVETTHHMILHGNQNTSRMQSFNYGMWDLGVIENSEFMILDFYILDPDDYLINTSIKKDDEIFVCRLKLTTKDSQLIFEDEFFPYKYRFNAADYIYGIVMHDRSDTEENPPTDIPNYSSGWIYENNYWFSLECAKCQRGYATDDGYPPNRSTKIDIEIIRSNIKPNFTYSMLYKMLQPIRSSGFVRRQPDITFTYYVEELNPSNIVYEELEYTNISNDTKMIIKYDEICEGL